MKELIHCKHSGVESKVFDVVIPFGDESLLAPCPQCYKAMQGAILSEILRDGIKAGVGSLMKNKTRGE